MNTYNYIRKMTCEFCGTKIKVKWLEGAVPTCPNCGAQLKIDESEIHIEKITEMQAEMMADARRRMKIAPIIAGVAMISMVTIFAIGMKAQHKKTSDSMQSMREENEARVEAMQNSGVGDISSITKQTTAATEESTEPTSDHSDFFGEEYTCKVLGRVLKWDAQMGGYYDSETKCFAYYNVDTVFPYVWEYWYEDYSSEYGWFKYDEDLGKWFCDQGTRNWVDVPSEVETSNFWFIDRFSTL